MQPIDAIAEAAPEVAAIRRDLHAHPELRFEEHRTSEVVARTLEGWGIAVERGIGGTGVVGTIVGRDGGASKAAVGLRADMDALPMTEVNTFAHASRHPGRMHACGHDGHVAMLLAAARHLARTRNFDGRVHLVFQPGEEGGAGAKAMIDDGLFERWPMQAIFGAHNWPGLAVGQFTLAPGPVYASSNIFKVVVRGKGAHGAMPHLGVDPVPAACAMVQAFQTIITRDRRPAEPGVISVTMIHAGEADNVIPDRCTMNGTVRTFSTELLDLIERRMREVAAGVAAAHGCDADFEFSRNYPPTVNHVEETDFARKVLQEVAGPGQVVDFEPTMGAEDFSFFLQKIPGCYFMIGNGDAAGRHRDAGHGLGPCMLHNPSYDFNDALIPIGATAWVRLAERWLAEPTRR